MYVCTSTWIRGVAPCPPWPLTKAYLSTKPRNQHIDVSISFCPCYFVSCTHTHGLKVQSAAPWLRLSRYNAVQTWATCLRTSSRICISISLFASSFFSDLVSPLDMNTSIYFSTVMIPPIKIIFHGLDLSLHKTYPPFKTVLSHRAISLITSFQTLYCFPPEAYRSANYPLIPILSFLLISHKCLPALLSHSWG